MKLMKSHSVRIVVAFLFLAAGLAPAASAATSVFKILLNTDNQIATGCDVTTLTGTFQGVERILNTTVTTTGPVAQVTSVTTQSCTAAPSTFSAPVAIIPPAGHPLPWTVGTNNGTSGSSVIETFIPQSALPGGNPPVMRLAVLAFDGTNTLRDEMVKATPGPGNGPPILLNAQAAAITDVPTLSEWGLIFLGLLLAAAAVALLRRRTATAFLLALLLLGGAGLAWAAASDLNGNTTAEWIGGTLLATDSSDAPVSTDMLAFYGQADPTLGGLSFRIDVRLFAAGNLPPTANNDTATVTEDDAATAINVLANDTDPESDPFTIASVTQPANGTVVITGGGTGLTYQPNANYCNTPPGTTKDTFTYSLNPGGATATVTVTVNCVDDNPTAVNDAATVTEGTSNNAIDVLANDTDPDAGPISVTSVTQPANGTVTITGGGTGVAYTPNAGYCNNPPGTALDTFTYTLTPGGSSATVTVTVTCVNDPPVANPDAATLTEDDPATAINVLANDTDPDGDPFTIASVTQPANGTVVITGGGTGLTYQPNANYCNTPPGTTLDTFTYTLTPGSNSATVTVTVNCVNDDPTAVDDTATVAEDDPATAINVLGNDTDPESDPFSITSVTQPANGTVVITGGGTGLTYQPNANYCNTPPGTALDTFTYTLTPGGDSATVTMTVTCQDDAPVAVADSATVAEDDPATSIPVLANDTDTDGGPISITSVTQPANGTVVITGGGTGLTYQPNANYCNTPPGTTLDTFTYTLTPGGSSATVTMTVTCQDDNPTAVADAATVGEDSGANAIPVLANDTDPDGGPISITSVTQPANGTVVITGGGTGLTYQPNANYCNTPPGTTLDTFTYTLTPGGSSATVTVTVTCSDDAPVAVADVATVGEDSGANAVNVLANDVDVDGGPISITSVTQPANGTVVITGGGTGLTYAPNANYCNTPPGTTLDTFTYSLAPGGSTATVTVTVTCLNDGPVVDLDANDDKGTGGSDFAVTFTEGDAATLIEDPADATVTDVDSATLASLTVTLTNLLDTGNETLATDVTGTSIVANYATVPGTGTLTLTGPDTVANFQTVLRKVTYRNTSNNPTQTPRTINFVANDGTTNSNTAVSTVTVVSVDTNPTAVADSTTVNEDSGATAINVLANDTDPDGGPISITSVTQPANGSVVITGGGTGLTYQPNPNYCNNPPGTTLDTFTYTLTPGGSSATVSVTVTCVDDNPVAVADSATVNEDSGATAIPVLANDTDVDGGAISITSVTQPANGTVVITGGGTGLTYQPNANYCNSVSGPADTFTYTLSPGGSSATVTVTVTCVDDNPVAVADSATVVEDSAATAVPVLANDTDVDGGAKSITSVTQPANGTVVITGGGTGLTYQPNPNYCNNPPGTTLDTFTYTLTPGGSSATVTMTVTCVDDPPVAVNDSATVVEDSGANAIPVLTNDTDIDAGPKSITSVTQPANGTVVITGGGTGLTYAPNANYCNSLSGTFDTFTYTLTPGGSSATVTITVTCVNDPPVADNDTFDFIGNTDLVVDLPALATPHVRTTTPSTLGVLDGDSDPVENNAISVTSITVGACTDSSAPLDCADPAVGRVQMQANGRFTFTPAPGDTGATETFQYTVTDDGLPAPASTVATVTLTRFARVWYVKNDSAAGGLGRSSDPFDTLAEAETASLAGDTIYVYFGDGTTTGLNSGILLKANQRLLGEGVQLDVPVSVNGGPNPTVLRAAGSQPLLDRTGGTGENVRVQNVTGVEIRGLNLAGNVNAVDITTTGANSAGVIIANNTFRSSGAEGIDVNAGGSGTTTLSIHDNTLTTTGNAIDIARTAGTVVITGFANNSVSGNTAGSGIVITGPVTFDSDTVTAGNQTVSGGTTVIGASGNGVGGAGLTMSSVTGTLIFTDLDIFADNGAGLRASGTGSFTLQVGAGVSIIEATGGPAVDVTSAAIDLQLSSLKSTNSATTGVSLDTVTGTFSAGSGSAISNATGTSFNVNAGMATITYNGTITNATGRSVSVTSKGSGSTTFNGTITATGGTGIFLNGNTGSTVSFTQQISLTTGANDAFTATGGGTVTSTDTTSTITTTTGIGLNVANTTIGAAGLKFRSISAGTAASGPSSGIVLNATGALGSLTVSGTGGAGSGGTIQRTTGAGISLTNTLTPSFASMNIQNTGRSGVKGTQVNGFTLTNTTINNSGTAAIAGSFDSNIAFNDQSVGTEQNLTGTVSITGNTLTNAQYHGVDITNFNGTLADLTVSNNTITSSTAAASSLGSGINLQALGSATTVANVTKATITNNVITNFPSGAGIQALGANANAAGPAGTFGTPGSASNVISITGNRVAGQSAANRLGTNGILVSATGKGQANFDVSSNGTVANPLANIAGFGIGVSVRGAVTVAATITNNVLAPNNTFASPAISVGADSLFATTDAPDLTATISNNTISQSDGNGILATVRNSNGIGRYKIQNNTVAAPLSGVRPGIRVDSGTASGNTTVCLNLSGNTSAGSGGSQGLGLRKQGTVTTTNTFGVNGMAATSSPGVEAYVDGLNPAGAGTLLISATSGFSNCSLP